jgi:hypothetical protein
MVCSVVVVVVVVVGCCCCCCCCCADTPLQCGVVCVSRGWGSRSMRICCIKRHRCVEDGDD